MFALPALAGDALCDAGASPLGPNPQRPRLHGLDSDPTRCVNDMRFDVERRRDARMSEPLLRAPRAARSGRMLLSVAA